MGKAKALKARRELDAELGEQVFTSLMPVMTLRSAVSADSVKMM